MVLFCHILKKVFKRKASCILLRPNYLQLCHFLGIWFNQSKSAFNLVSCNIGISWDHFQLLSYTYLFLHNPNLSISPSLPSTLTHIALLSSLILSSDRFDATDVWWYESWVIGRCCRTSGGSMASNSRFLCNILA